MQTNSWDSMLQLLGGTKDTINHVKYVIYYIIVIKLQNRA